MPKSLVKTCKTCGETKGTSLFASQIKRGKEYVSLHCRSCDNERKKAYYAANPEKLRDKAKKYQLKSKYGLSEKDLAYMLEASDHRCEICNTSVEYGRISLGAAHIDHCHETGKVRGVLCSQCNLGLGHFRDDVTYLENAISYLEKHS